MNDWRTAKVLDHGFVHLRDSMPGVELDDVELTDGLGDGDYRICSAVIVFKPLMNIFQRSSI